jgi:hypothetical protein
VRQGTGRSAVVIARKKFKRGKRLKDPADLPLALRVYLHVLAGERPLDDLTRICSEDVFVQHDAKDRVQGIEAVRELIAFRREHLAGPPIGIKRMKSITERTLSAIALRWTSRSKREQSWEKSRTSSPASGSSCL